MNALEIRQKRKSLGLTQKELAEKLGISFQTLNGYENGKEIPSTKYQILDRILNQTHLISDEEIIDTKKKPQQKKSEIKEVPFDDFMEAEYLPIKVQAGYLAGLEENHPIALKKMLVPKEFEKGYYKVIEIEGDSMNDGTPRSICDGDKLLLKEVEGGDYLKKTLPYRNNLFVIVSKEGIVCKQIIAQDIEKECVVCHSFNSLHTDYEICFEDIYQLFYVKKLVERKIKF